MLQSANDGIIIIPADADGTSATLTEAGRRWPSVLTSYHSFCYAATPNDRIGKLIQNTVSDRLVVAAVVVNHFSDSGIRIFSYPALHCGFLEIAQLASNTGLPVHYQLFDSKRWPVISEVIENSFQAYPNVHRTLWIMDNLQ